ncbi:YhjD/YihY/BrkB family envelope integrity protein [Amycolatopsis sp. H20-H5]|uniref:YhjD/YihY/BrkB family envelope integrity protein n=1 Tax=Amycolatopsis sp. H20-H5 TaxID=3046309 RepID=UPI002DBECCD3|nr:YhjD/YihY/BrkB family envelope integrity protein [Amycolatopsis sp. H20-H5]MEC3974799.1 YhjD/YihY/BrkB family envelope integrity protein [Amycolatopsis sp. H20-H5]
MNRHPHLPAPQPAPPSRWKRLRARYRWLDHLARATNRYVDYGGYQYVASITYFSLLSLIPLVMVGTSIAGFVLASQPHLRDSLLNAITNTLPGSFGEDASKVLKKFIDQRTNVGVLGLIVGLYSGWNWTNALRDALTALWGQKRADIPFWQLIVKDLVALLGLSAALLVSFSITISGTALGGYLLRLAGLADTSWGHQLLSAASIPLALLADWLVFLWVLTRLPRDPVGVRSAVRGAIAAAIGFELLKQAGGIYLRLISDSPTGATFGSVIGLLFFISLVARLLVFITAWTATGSDAPPRPVQPPSPVVLRPMVVPRSSPVGPAALGVVTGVLGTLWALKPWRRKGS